MSGKCTGEPLDIRSMRLAIESCLFLPILQAWPCSMQTCSCIYYAISKGNSTSACCRQHCATPSKDMPLPASLSQSCQATSLTCLQACLQLSPRQQAGLAEDGLALFERLDELRGRRNSLAAPLMAVNTAALFNQLACKQSCL